MSNVIGRHYAWCVFKSVVVRDDDGFDIGKIVFGQSVAVLERNSKKSKIMFNSSKSYGIGKKFINGWVLNIALSYDPVEYMAKLFFRNISDKRLPVSNRYKGEIFGYIMPNEKVEMIAKCGKWCFTNRGWTMFEWLTKCGVDCDTGALNTLAYAVMTMAAKDYTLAVKKIKTGKCRDPESFSKAIGTIDEVTRWFKGREYNFYFDDSGEEKLYWMNESLGIDKKWLKDKHRMYDEMRRKGLVKKYDSSGRHTTTEKPTSSCRFVL
jgi:hypothetical protein